MAEAPSDPHLSARGTLVDDGRGGVRPAPAPRFSRTPGALEAAPSAEELLARWA